MNPITQGRQVNFTGGIFSSGERDIYSATVNSVNADGSVNLTVFAKDGTGATFPANNVIESGGEGGWSWPEIKYKLVPIEEGSIPDPLDANPLTGLDNPNGTITELSLPEETKKD